MLETRFVTQLGRTVTRLGLGALPMGPLQRTLSVEEGARVVRAAVEGGITFIDTATLYGTYEPIARGLKGWRGPVTLATKTHAKTDRALAEKHLETALKELGRETIDIMLCHCARQRFIEAEWGPTLEALLAARAKGLVRMVGMNAYGSGGVGCGAASGDGRDPSAHQSEGHGDYRWRGGGDVGGHPTGP